MGYFSSWFGRKPAPPGGPSSQIASGNSQNSKIPAGSDIASRRKMLAVVLRDTLNRHGIPVSWIGAEMLVATSRSRESGIHWRLQVKHWDPRLMTHAVALQHQLIKRVTTFDPMAANWLMGISWQFALQDESVCPALPHPGLWTAEPHEPAAAAAPVAPGGSGDVIAGPVLIGKSRAAGDPAETPKADLERLMAVRDADFQQHAQGEGSDGPEATQPMYLKTQPMQL